MTLSTRDHSPESFRNNQLLAAFSEADLQRLASDLKPIVFENGQVLYDNQSGHDLIYFPKSGILSVYLTSSKEVNVELGVVGHEGAANLLPSLFGKPTIGRCNVQVVGNGWQMEGAVLHREFADNSAFRHAVWSYLHFWNASMAQGVLCNRLHTLEERLCRWLLMTQDRTGTQILELSQQSLAIMLGTGETSVTLTAKVLAQEGLIDYGKRYIILANRKGLEAKSCECYGAIRRQFGEHQFEHGNLWSVS